MGAYKQAIHMLLVAMRRQTSEGVTSWYHGVDGRWYRFPACPETPILCGQHGCSRAPNPKGLKCHNKNFSKDQVHTY